MKTIAILLAVTAATLVGDYFIKVASGKADGLVSAPFVIGLALYSLPALGWFYLMKSHSLAVIGVLYSATTIFLLSAMSALIFHEAVGWREVLGVTLSIMAVLIVGIR